MNQDDVNQQRELLAANRRTLGVLLIQLAQQGSSFAPPSTFNGISEARTNIRQIKRDLRAMGVTVDDASGDEPNAAEQIVPSGAFERQVTTSDSSTPTDKQFVERSDSVSQGMRALNDLMHTPPVREAVIIFQTVFQNTCEQIANLAFYKELHDLLHDFQYQCYNMLVQDVQLFPDDDSAVDRILRYKENLERVVSGIQDTADHAPPNVRTPEWIAELLQTQEYLSSAIEQLDAPLLRRVARLMARLLSLQPTKINTHLNDAVHDLRLPALIRALTQVRDKLAQLNLDPAKVHDFEAGIAALSSLQAELDTLAAEHDSWQGVDCELRRIEDLLDYGLDELLLSWPQTCARAESLYQISSEKWAVALKTDAERLTQAISANDSPKMLQSFRSYRSKAGNRFFRVDKKLKELCGELRQIDGPLASVLRMME